MATKLGTTSHAKGYVIDKLRKQKRFGGSHVPVRFLSQGYPLEWRYLITKALEELGNEGLTLSSTEVGRFSSHSRRLHGSHTARVPGAANRPPVS